MSRAPFVAVLPLLLVGCGPRSVKWAVQDGVVTPDQSGLVGEQAWSFFANNWGSAKGDKAFVCARAQTLTGTASSPLPGCATCTVAYTLAVAETESDCDADLADDPSYTLPVAMGIGPVDDALAGMDPHEGRSLGWYASFDGENLEPYGFAWDAAIDAGEDPGPPGWNPGQSYTLWAAYAWDLSTAPAGG